MNSRICWIRWEMAMNKKEIAQVLAILRTAYPNTKIDNPAGMVQAWEWTLGSYSAESVIKAARLHMATSKFFPAPAEIIDKIVRAEIVYNESEIELRKLEGQDATKRLETHSGEKKGISDEGLDNICRSVGLGYPNEIEKDDDYYLGMMDD